MLMQQILNGLVVGSVYVMFSLGFTLIFGLARVLNLAHGAVFMWGALVGVFIADSGQPFVVVLLAAALVAGLLSVMLELLVFKQLRRRGASEFSVIVASIGAGLVLMSAAQQITDTQVLRYPFDTFPTIVYRFWGLRLSLLQIVMVVSVVVTTVVLSWYIYRTDFGRQLRAASLDERTARLLGVNPQPVYVKTFFLAGAMAGAAGAIIGLAFNSVHFLMGEPYLLRALIIVVIGGLGSIAGAVVAGLGLGTIQTLVTAAGYSGIADAILFGVLFVVLLLRPHGLFGNELQGGHSR